MNHYDEMKVMINGLERATSICTKEEIMALYEAVSLYYNRRVGNFSLEEEVATELRLDDAMTLINIRNPEVKDG